MSIYDLRKNDVGVITGFRGGREFKMRLSSLGVVKGAKFKLKAVTIQRNTFEIEINNSMIALRRGEAMKIEVEKCPG
jgi:Fe2+ transport system protein FeoA